MPVKLVFCCRRRPEMSREEFVRYWLESHGPLVRKLQQALPQMRRYVQSHTLDSPLQDALREGRGAAEAYDGITEVWFDDLESFGGSDTQAAADAVRQLIEDERRFLDMTRSCLFLTEEHPIF